jgi:hypothetical protein
MPVALATSVRNEFHVRFGSLAHICGAKERVRFTPESGHSATAPRCPLSANSGHHFIQLIRAEDQRWRNGEAECLRGVEFDR